MQHHKSNSLLKDLSNMMKKDWTEPYNKLHHGDATDFIKPSILWDLQDILIQPNLKSMTKSKWTAELTPKALNSISISNQIIIKP